MYSQVFRFPEYKQGFLNILRFQEESGMGKPRLSC